MNPAIPSSSSFPRPLALLLAALAPLAALEASADESALLAAPKVAAKHHQPDLMVSKRPTRGFIGNNIYRDRISPLQILPRSAGPMVLSYFKIQNDTRRVNAPTHSVFLLRGSATTHKASASYMSRGRNVTALVARGRYALNIPAGADRTLVQKVSMRGGHAAHGHDGSSGGLFSLKARHATGRSDTAAVLIGGGRH
jgi:hypothetical protein